jgi:hypothetical protein
MYREEIAQEKYNKPLSELTEDEVKALDEAIPFKLVSSEAAPAEETVAPVEETTK